MKLYLVRHGSAGVRQMAEPNDCERHLDPDGLVQAALIAKHLCREAGDQISRVLSSPSVRCLETVEPTAQSLGLAVEPEPLLFEGTDIEASWPLLESLVAAHQTAVLSSHGDVIPELIGRARGRGMAVSGKSGCSKGSIWELEWDGSMFSTGSYLARPSSVE